LRDEEEGENPDYTGKDNRCQRQQGDAEAAIDGVSPQ
jgi:hypothetical protein